MVLTCRWTKPTNAKDTTILDGSADTASDAMWAELDSFELASV